MKLVYATELRTPTYSRALTDTGIMHRLVSYYETRKVKGPDKRLARFAATGNTTEKIRPRHADRVRHLADS